MLYNSVERNSVFKNFYCVFWSLFESLLFWALNSSSIFVLYFTTKILYSNWVYLFEWPFYNNSSLLLLPYTSRIKNSSSLPRYKAKNFTPFFILLLKILLSKYCLINSLFIEDEFCFNDYGSKIVTVWAIYDSVKTLYICLCYFLLFAFWFFIFSNIYQLLLYSFDLSSFIHKV